MDTPQRANAAQLAARSIKAKPKGRTGRTVTGPRPDSVPQFAQPSQNGLFGGNIQGSGSFDFSAPGGMTFTAPSFGSNATPSPDVSDNEGRFPGDDRAMKRQFGGPSTMQQNPPAVQQPDPFGQTSVNPFGTSTAQATPGGNIFSFGNSSGPSTSNIFNTGNAPASNPFSFGGISQPAPASPSISFGSGPAESKPANSPFQFGQQAAQPQSFNSPFNFNASTSQEKPATSHPQASTPVFTFGSTAQQSASQPQAPKSPFTFGSTTAQERPAATPFVFGQSPAPSGSGVNFGSKPATAPPMNNLFGTSTSQPAQTANIFAPAAIQSPTSNAFGSTSVASPATNNLFGSREQSPAPTGNNLFGGPANTSSTSQPPPTPNLFGEQKSAAPNNIFGGLNKPASTGNMFSSPVKKPTPANNLFGKPNSEQTGTKDLFGTLNKSVDESVKQHKANSGFGGGSNGDGSATSKSEAKFPFNQNPATTLFGQSSSNNANNGATHGAKSHISSASTSSSLQHTPNISSPLKTVNAPMAASQPPPSGMFPNLPQPSKSLQKATQAEIQVNFLGTSFPLPADHPALASGPDPFNITDEQIAQVLPGHLKDDPQAKANWVTKYRIDGMNQAMSAMFEALPADVNPRPTLLRYIKLRCKLVEEHNAQQEQFSQSGTNSNDSARDTATNPFRITDSATPGQTPTKRKLTEDEDQENENENPSKRTKEQSTHAQAPAVPEPKPQSNGIGGSATSKPSHETSPFKPAAISQNGNPSSNLPTPSPMKNKRKAESQITKDTEEASPLRQIKTPKLNGSTVGSNTSNIFKNILDSPSPLKSGSPTKFSPEKKTATLPEPKEDTPRINPFGKLPVPASPTKSTLSPSPSAPSNTFTSKATPASSSLFAPLATPGTKNAFTPKASSTPSLFNAKIAPAVPNTSTPKVAGTPVGPFSSKPAVGAPNDSASARKESTLKPPVFASGPVDFLAQFGKKASEDKEDNEKKLLQKAIDADYDSDDGDLEEFKAKYHEKRKAELKALEDLAKNTRNAFVPKTDGVDESGSNSPTPEPSNKVAATAGIAAPKPFFSQNNATQGSGNSVFSSLNVSRTSTPGPFGSSTGSVLDGHASAKPVSFGGNIFGHLSDADSGKGNDADDESAEEDSDGDEENRDPNYQPGDDDASGPGTPASETGDGIASAKKTNFFSNYGTPKASGSSTPGGGLFGRVGSKEPATEKEQSGVTTPGRSLFDRIGSKDTSTEKEQSGTTTPGGSLFDRITKDSNGNPVRHISTEEKENTQPSTANIFKDVGSPFGNPFNKTPGAPADQTWKPDSPIRFGSTADTETSNSAPTVSIIAATPTKTPSNLFGGPTSAPASNLFGSKDSKPAFSNLFGNSSSAKGPASANVGFGFGAPSVTSSLFPSAAGSANTSRATSPGATTDADSGADGDPDAEVHEQIDLTSGGPGEENEEVLFEVRAKARMFTTTPDDDGNQWVTKGLGPLRVLQDKDTKAVRMLLRADPLGTVVLNKALLSQVEYKASAKTVKLLTNADDGKGLETWLLQVKTEELAKELAKVLEKNKSS